jgi:hypothetical protein
MRTTGDRRAAFLSLQRAAAAAVTRRTDEIQDGAPWLARCGEETYD